MRYMIWAIVLMVVVPPSLYGLHRLGLWAEERGYLYYKHKKGTGGSYHNAAMELERFMRPSTEHTITAEEQQVESEENDGE